MTLTSLKNTLKSNQLWLFILAIIIGSFLRLYKLGEIPYGFTWDEAAITYDAWGIADWHRDQWSNLMPLTFKSFGDYKAPVLIYFLASSFMITGIQEISIRLVSALAGIGLIVVGYYLAKTLFPKLPWIAPLTSLLLAISPWSVHLSRIGLEANVATTIVALSVWLFLLAKNKPWLYVISAFGFLISFYTYQSTKIVVPLLLLLLTWYDWKNICQAKRATIASGLLLLIGLLPIGLTFSRDGGERARQALLVFNNGQMDVSLPVLKQLLINIANHATLAYWVQGVQDNWRHIVPGFGVVYWASLVFLLIGLVHLFKHQRRIAGLLIGWILIGLLPSILSRVSPHTLRSAITLVPVIITVAYGLVASGNLVKRKWRRWVSILFIICVTAAYAIQLTLFLQTYTSTYATESALSFQYGYKQAFEIIRTEGKSVDKIVMTDAYGQPYIYALLYSRYRPEQYQQGALANYEFHSVDWSTKEDNRLYVGTPEEIPIDDPQVVDVVTIPETDIPVFIIAKT